MVHVIFIILGILILVAIFIFLRWSILKRKKLSELDSFMELDKQKHETEIQQKKAGEKLVKHLVDKEKELTKEKNSLKKIVKYVKKET